MFYRKYFQFVAILSAIVSNLVDFTHCNRCSRIPEGSGARRTPSPGNFRIRLSEDSGLYKPGRTYSVWLERSSNSLRSRDRPRQTFIGFMLAVEEKKNSTSEFSDDFSAGKHGTFKIIEEDTLTKLICGNVVTHTSDSAKNEIQVLWTAPERGSGCVTFRATIIEHRDVWYMDDGPLSKDFCEDEENQEDYISTVLEECCACYEAKYELTFEGLWSRNTHPKGFPRNVYTTKFGDIIGATHKIGYGFWANGEFASDGLREVAEMGSTRTLESELKNKSDSIRTIIKARGLAYPNITGKTFAVFRVDSINHLMSFVSMISPSPDWFVGVSGLELCQPDCTWLEKKVVELYPWDAGTDKGTTYDSPDQPSKPQDYVRRITSESPNNNDSPFYSASGLKMKPLARLTLLRQRLYEKNCTADQTASDDCQVSEYDGWGECTGAVCGGTGKRYRQRYYKNADSATKCNRKLFETKTCILPPCTEDDNDGDGNESERDLGTDDPNCKGSYGDWGPCMPKCKNSENERGKRTRTWKYEKGYFKACAGRVKRPPQTEYCDIEWCVDPNLQTESETETPNEQTENNEEEEKVDCENATFGPWKYTTPCNVTCGSGMRNRSRISNDRNCEDETETVTCTLKPCKNKEFCDYLPNLRNCIKNENAQNYIYYNSTSCSCNEVFTTRCQREEYVNMFETPEECMLACPEAIEGCNGAGYGSENTYDGGGSAIGGGNIGGAGNQWQSNRNLYRNRGRN